MAPLPMRCLIEKVVRFPRTETVRLTGPTELDLIGPDQAKFVMCNHTIEQDHRSMKQVTRLLLEFKSFEVSQGTLVGIELGHTFKKGQMGEKRRQKDSLRPNSSTPWQPHPEPSGVVSIPRSKFATDPAYVRAKSAIDTRRCVSFLRIAC
jgi:hypothetical protein